VKAMGSICIDQKIKNLFQNNFPEELKKEIARGISLYHQEHNKEFYLSEVTSDLQINVNYREDTQFCQIDFSFVINSITSAQFKTLFGLNLYNQTLCKDIFLSYKSRGLNYYLSGKNVNIPNYFKEAEWFDRYLTHVKTLKQKE
jgi:hypothetical protein